MFLLYCCHARVPYHGLSALLGSVCVLGEKGWRSTACCKGQVFRGQSFSQPCLISSEKLPCWRRLSGGTALGCAQPCMVMGRRPGRRSRGKHFPGFLMAADSKVVSALALPSHPPTRLLFAPPAAVMSAEAPCPVLFSGRMFLLCSL